MSFQISAVGTREGVAKAIQDAKTQLPTDDQEQLKAVKAMLLSELKSLPAEFNGCRLVVEGDARPGVRTLSVNLMPQKLHV